MSIDSCWVLIEDTDTPREESPVIPKDKCLASQMAQGLALDLNRLKLIDEYGYFSPQACDLGFILAVSGYLVALLTVTVSVPMHNLHCGEETTVRTEYGETDGFLQVKVSATMHFTCLFV